MSSSSPLLGAASFNSMSSRAKSFLNDGGNRLSPTKTKKKRGLRHPLAFLGSPFHHVPKTVPHVRLDDGGTVDQIKNEISLLQDQVRDLNQSYQYHTTVTRDRPSSDDSNVDGDKQWTNENADNHSRQLEELNRKLMHIQSGLVAIECERRQLLTKGKHADQHIETLEDQLSSKNTQIHLLQEENLKLRQQSLYRDESGPLKMRQMKKKYDHLSGNFVKVCEKLAKTTKRVSNMEFEKKALISLNQALQSKIQRVENRNRQELENTKDILKHNARQLADLEDLLNEKSKLIDKLGDELAEKESSEAVTVKSLAGYFDRKLQLARRQHETDTQALEHSHKQQVNALQRQLNEKSAEFDALRAEFDSQMQRLMSATAEIERFSDERATIGTLVARLEALDRECEDYKEVLFAKDTTIAMLRADNMKREIEINYAMALTKNAQSPDRQCTAIGSEYDDTPLIKFDSVGEPCNNAESAPECLEVQEIIFDNKQEIISLQRQLKEKSAECEALRSEFDSQMQRLMSATAEIDRFSDERAAIETLVARLVSLDRECEDYKEVLFAKDTKIAVLRADNMKKDLEMKYAIPSNRTATSPVRQTGTDGSEEHMLSHPLVTPDRSLFDKGTYFIETSPPESPEMQEIRFENALLKERLRLSEHKHVPKVQDIYTTCGGTTISTVTTCLNESFEWDIEEESRITNSSFKTQR